MKNQNKSEPRFWRRPEGFRVFRPMENEIEEPISVYVRRPEGFRLLRNDVSLRSASDLVRGIRRAGGDAFAVRISRFYDVERRSPDQFGSEWDLVSVETTIEEVRL